MTPSTHVRNVVVLAGCCGLAISLAGCGGGSAASATTVTQTVVRETVTVTPPAPETTSVAESAAEPPATAEPAAPEVEFFTMPKLVGKNLQLAQDTLQSLGSYVLDQEDASGLGRLQVNDSNWKVCSQRPKAGSKTPTDTVVLLASVKLDETC